MARSEFHHVDEDIVSRLIDLSNQWVREDCSHRIGKALFQMAELGMAFHSAFFIKKTGDTICE